MSLDLVLPAATVPAARGQLIRLGPRAADAAPVPDGAVEVRAYRTGVTVTNRGPATVFAGGAACPPDQTVNVPAGQTFTVGGTVVQVRAVRSPWPRRVMLAAATVGAVAAAAWRTSGEPNPPPPPDPVALIGARFPDAQEAVAAGRAAEARGDAAVAARHFGRARDRVAGRIATAGDVTADDRVVLRWLADRLAGREKNDR
jgi:hypothetical protein